jgi:hypothetical protein
MSYRLDWPKHNPCPMQVALGEWNTKVDPDINEQGQELPRLVRKNLDPVMFLLFISFTLY